MIKLTHREDFGGALTVHSRSGIQITNMESHDRQASHEPRELKL